MTPFIQQGRKTEGVAMAFRRHRFARLAVAGAILVALVAVNGRPAVAQRPPGMIPNLIGVIPNQYIVVLNDSAPGALQLANEHAQRYGVDVSQVYEVALRGYAARIPAAALVALRADPRVLFISEDREVQAIQTGSGGQVIPTGVNRIDAELSSTRATAGVAVIDTGSTHTELNVVGGYNCVPDNNSWGRITRTNYKDQNGHGTHVAGTIGAKNDTVGVAGVAPGVPIYSVRVLNKNGSGTWSQVICGIDWVTANSNTIKVANMSLGGGGADDNNCGASNNDALHRAICNSVKKGVTYVAAAGNDGKDLAGFVPATYNEVLTVTAVADFNGGPGGGATSTCRSDVDDTAADFSNYAVNELDKAHTIAAPGVCINSTWLNNGYNTISGTSMASPHVAGAVALCLAGPSCSGLTPSQIIAKLRSDAAGRPAAYGFTDDPNSPNGTRYYGNLVYAGGY
jgi:subtilisin